MEFHIFTLPNGIRVIHKQTDREVAHCGLVVNAGSRDELEDEQGLAHFIEHCIFKGTSKRKTYHILSRLDAVGAEINAYTTKEETWIYASFVNKHFDRAAELIADICFNSTFPEKEIKKEKDVIIDEINSYQDSPSETIFDDFEEQVFDGHPIGRNILGTVDSVKKFSRESILKFIFRHYRTDQMVFSVVGNIPAKKVERVVRKYFSESRDSAIHQKRIAFNSYLPRHIERNEDTHQVHYVLGNTAYHHDHPQKTGLILLNNYLGGPGMNSRLNLMIREKYGFAYNIESHYQSYYDTGIFEVYLGTDEKTFEKGKKLIFKELALLREKKLGTAQLHSAKQQLIGQFALAQESGSGIMLAIGKSFLLYDKVDSVEEVYKKINEVTSSDIMEIANEILQVNSLSSLTFK
jgi:predicted Zn-dependent peptidase